MSFAQVADIADVLAAIGVIVSLLIVAYEVRKNTAEVKRTRVVGGIRPNPWIVAGDHARDRRGHRSWNVICGTIVPS
jgi:hypothetical protein